MSARLPPSLLRQHSVRYSQGAITLEQYRAKRSQILNNIHTMHTPLDQQDSGKPLFAYTHFGSNRKTGRSRTDRKPPTASEIILLSVLSFTAAAISLLPNARTTIAAITSTLALTAPAVAIANRTDPAVAPANAFQEFAAQLAEKKSWQIEQIDQVLRLWSKLDSEQRYSARRYTGYNELLSTAVERAADYRELIEVSTLDESLEASARQFDRISKALLNQ